MAVDGYKLDHRRQYPNYDVKSDTFGDLYVQSNLTARGSRVPGTKKTRWLGLQMAILQFLDLEMREFFKADIDKVAKRYTRRVNKYLGPNKIGEAHIRQWHALGYTPLRFDALPEGSAVPLRVPYFLVSNTHPDFGWLVNYYETLLSCELWGPSTSATTAFRLRGIGQKWADITGSPAWFLDYQFHDFSMRGMMGVYASALSGIGHLLAFKGTDTLPAIDAVEFYYGTDPTFVDLPGVVYSDLLGAKLPEDFVVGVSVAATEHSVMCAGGEDDEFGTYSRLLDVYLTGILSIVSDTWDYWNVLTDIIPRLKDRILARDGKVVIRPDSGDPVKIVVGDPDAPVGSPEYKGTVELLWETFGGTITETGHKLLDSHIGVIYGDSINDERAEAILAGLAAKGFASANIVFGVGSFTYQYVTRDTHNMAMKATWCEINGEPRAIFKKPKTDNGTKHSAKGRLAALRDENGELVLVNEATPEQEAESAYRLLWKDGTWFAWESWDQIVARAHAEPL
jgi:nicotinamide phosphoribosyltransferase